MRRHPDYLILFCLGFLVIFGLVMLTSASSNLGKTKFDDTYYYLKHQLLYGFSLGVVGFFLMLKIHYRSYARFAFPALLVSIGLLVLVFTPLGITTNSSARWVSLGGISFQPAEILKLTLIVYIASWLSKDAQRSRQLGKGFIPLLAVIGVVAALLLKQPSTSTVAILILAGLIMYFVSGAKLRYIATLFVGMTLVLALVTIITPYRFERVKNFLNPTTDISGGGFHLNQARIAIGSGKLLGVGFGKSTTKLGYLPEPVGDSIFAIIAEELGFVGVSVLVGVFLILILRIFLLARRVSDTFGELLLIGFGALIALQTVIHIAAISGLLPLTGTPLPFISYGGTALAVFMTMGGIIANISKYARQ
jgi:cell division protein FtsW